MRDYFDNSVKSVDDVEEMLGIPVIASIPKNRKFKKLLK